MSCSTWSFTESKTCLISDSSFGKIVHAITGLETPHARPKAALLGTKTYGTFLSSHKSGRCKTISMGSASAANIINSELFLLSDLVAF